MCAILKFDFQKIKQLNFSEENYLNYTPQKDIILHVIFKYSLKQDETRTKSGPIWMPFNKENKIK